MRPLLPLLALLIAAPAAAHIDTPQEALASALKGMVPDGRPEQCLLSRQADDVRLVDEHTIVYRMGASRAWVNHPRGGCLGLQPGRTLITHSPEGQLCAGDLTHVVDLVSHMQYGTCSLGAFEPWRRAK